MKELVPEFVSAKLSETATVIFQERAITSLDETLDLFLANCTFWNVLIGAIEGIFRTSAISREGLLRLILPIIQHVLYEHQLLHSGQALGPTVPVAQIIRYKRVRHEPLG